MSTDRQEELAASHAASAASAEEMAKIMAGMNQGLAQIDSTLDEPAPVPGPTERDRAFFAEHLEGLRRQATTLAAPDAAQDLPRSPTTPETDRALEQWQAMELSPLRQGRLPSAPEPTPQEPAPSTPRA